MQAPALPGAHRAVVEVEVQVPDVALLLIGDLAEGLPRRQRRVDGDRDLGRVEPRAGERERARGRELEAVLRRRVAALEVRDPHRAVDGRPADGAGALGDDLPRAPAQRPLRVRAEEMELGALDRVQDPRVAFGRADLAQDGLRGVGIPVDGPHVLGHQRAGLAGRRPGAELGRRRRAGAVGDPAHRLDERLDRGPPHLVSVQAALAHLAGAEGTRRPHRAGVGLAVGLEDRDAPCRRAELDRPVQRRRPAVAPRAWVHDQAAMLRPDRLRDHRLEHRADDQLRAVLVHGRLHGGGRVDDGDRHLVAQLGQRDPRALAEAVVSRYEEEHPQRPPRVARVAAPDLAPHRSEPTAVTLILLTHRTSHHIAPKAIESTFRRRHRGPHSFL